jgi:hypothetical protein
MPLLRSRCTAVWSLLILATLLSAWVGTGHGDRTLATLVVIVIAFVKLRWVGLYFMELRDAPLALRAVFEGYVAVVSGVVVGLYLS